MSRHIRAESVFGAVIGSAYPVVLYSAGVSGIQGHFARDQHAPRPVERYRWGDDSAESLATAWTILATLFSESAANDCAFCFLADVVRYWDGPVFSVSRDQVESWIVRRAGGVSPRSLTPPGFNAEVN